MITANPDKIRANRGIDCNIEPKLSGILYRERTTFGLRWLNKEEGYVHEEFTGQTWRIVFVIIVITGLSTIFR
jgi:hypothetical protein